MADEEYILRKKIITYLTENYSDIFMSQYSMIAFNDVSYNKALRFGQTEDQIIKEITAISDFMDLVNNKV